MDTPLYTVSQFPNRSAGTRPRSADRGLFNCTRPDPAVPGGWIVGEPMNEPATTPAQELAYADDARRGVFH